MLIEPDVERGFRYRIYVDGALDAEQRGEWPVDEAPAGSGILMVASPNSSGADHPRRTQP